MRSPWTGCFVVIGFLTALSSPAAAAVEIEAYYSNSTEGSLQDMVEQLCDEAPEGARITIHIAPGDYHEQVSTTIGCGRAVSWRFVGAGIGQTTLFAAGVNSNFRNLPGSGLFVALIACGTRNPWTYPSGENICDLQFPGNTTSTKYCRMGAKAPDAIGAPPGAQVEPFEPFTTSCELSNLTLDGTGAATSAMAMAWGSLIAHDIEVKNFVNNQLGCQNCRDVDIEDVQLTCRTGGAIGGLGVALAANTITWPVGEDNHQTGTRIVHSAIQRCNFGILAARQEGGLILQNHIDGSGSGIVVGGAVRMHIVSNWVSGSTVVGLHLGATHQSTVASNLFSDNVKGVLFAPPVPFGPQGFDVPSSDVNVVGNVSYNTPEPLASSNDGSDFSEHGTKVPAEMPDPNRWGWPLSPAP